MSSQQILSACFRGDSKLGSCETPVKSCSSTDQLIALIYASLRACKLIYALCSLIVNSLMDTL